MTRPPSDGVLPDRWRTVLALALVVTLTLGAGCSALGSTSGQTSTPTANAPAPTTTSTMETPTPGTTAGPGGGASTQASGRMTVVVGANELTDAVDTGSFQYDPTANHAWNASGGTTLADALSTLGVDATADTLTYEGQTYRDGANGTTVSYRVNGDVVDPTRYVLSNDDDVWVVVDYPGMNRSTPGTYIPDADQHIHGHINMTVNGQVVNFNQSKYQTNDRYFHFEDGTAKSWHAHSYGITLQYALSSLAGINATDDSITYDGTTYRNGDAGTTVQFLVNGDPVTPSRYYLKDWDHVKIVVNGPGS